jgi:peptidoglycan/LPS O-acetylase OafA/YrhL
MPRLVFERMAVSTASVAVPRVRPERSSVAYASYRPDVDGLRALAILGVVGFHAAPTLVPGGFAGVDVFFVISGFLISGNILRALTQRSFSFADFYARRVKRIFPALIVTLAAVWALGWLILLPDEFQLLGKHIAAGAGFSLNLISYQDFNWYFMQMTTPLAHLWSLGVEEQFYLLWPLFLVAIWKWGRWPLALLTLVAAVSFVLNVTAMASDPMASFYLPSCRLWELSIGGALAYVQLHHREESRQADPRLSFNAAFRRSQHVLSLIGAALLMASYTRLDAGMPFPGWWALAPSSGALLLIGAGPRSWVNRYVLARPVLVFVGLISYPLYLWHWPLLELASLVEWPAFVRPATTALAVGAAVILAFLTYRYLERPIRFSANKTRPALVLCTAMILCGSIGYMTFSGRIPPYSYSQGVAPFVRAATEDYWPPGHHNVRQAWVKVGFFRLGSGRRHVLFIGDSNMQQYYPRIARILADHPSNSHSAVFAVRGMCALGAVEIVGQFRAACQEHLQDAVRYANDPNVDTVVIGGTWYLYFVDFPDTQFGAAGPLKPGTDRALDSLERVVAAWVRHGKRVYLVLNMPVGISLDPREMIRRTLLPPAFRIDIHSPARAAIDAALGPIDARLERLARETGATVIDPVPSLCNATSCPAITPDGEPMYHDANHLRPSYVRDSVHFLDETILDGGPALTAR